MKKKWLFFSVFAVLAMLVIAATAWLVLGKKGYRTLEIIESGDGNNVHRAGKTIQAYEGMKLRSGDYVSVDEDSYVRMCFDGDKYVYLEGRALMKLTAAGTKKDSRTVVDIELGEMVTELTTKLSDKASYEINSPNTTMAIRGTVTVSEVRYELEEAIADVMEADILAYLINTKADKKAELTQKDEEIKAVFEQGVKAKVTSYVQQGKVELTVYEKTVENGITKLVATTLPLKKGKGVVSIVSDIVAPDMLRELEVKEKKQVETIEELESVLTTNRVRAMEAPGGTPVTSVTPTASAKPAPTEVPEEPTETPTPTTAPTATPVPTEIPAEPTEAPVPTKVPQVTEVPEVTITPEIPTPPENPVTPEKPALPEVPVPSKAPVIPAEPEEKADFTYSVVGQDNIRLNRVTNTSAKEVVIPGYISGKKVVGASPELFYGCTALTMIRLRDDVDPESNLLVELLTASLSCMGLREVHLPISYAQYLTEDLPLGQVPGIEIKQERNSVVIRLQTSLFFLAPGLAELVKQYQ